MLPYEENLFRAVESGQTAEAAGVLLGLPPSKVNRLCLKWSKMKLYTYRSRPELGWLTDAGRAKLAGNDRRHARRPAVGR
jgi:hypothetical protein